MANIPYDPSPILKIVRAHIKSHGINKDNINSISEDRQKHYILYECAAAIIYKMYLWCQLPNEILDKIGAIRKGNGNVIIK